MKRKHLLIISVLLLICRLMCGCGGGKQNSEDSMTDRKTTDQTTALQSETAGISETVKETQAELPKVAELAASDKSFTSYIRFIGRKFYRDRAQAYYFNYSLAGFTFTFNGTGVKAELNTGLGNGTEKKNAILNVYVDDMTMVFAELHLDKKAGTYILCENLPAGEHTVLVSKRTDISYSSAGIKSLTLMGDGAYFTAPPAEKERKILFMGDSITSGDGDLGRDGGSYISENQDAHVAYAKITADYFGADYQLLSRCGLGLVWNSSQKAPEDGGVSLPMIFDYNNYYDDERKTKYDHNSFVPDVVVINIGTNDKTKVTADTANKTRWMDTYIEFLETVRETYPDASIICCYGSMIDGSVDLGLEDVVNRAKSNGIKDIYYLRFPLGSVREFGIGVGGHPTAKKQRYDAEEYLIPLIRSVRNWE